MARTPASGIQHTIRAGEYEAVIASVGATLRSLTFAGRDLVVPFGADEVRPAHRGATLAPWPNRVVDGAYSFGGREFQLALTEPARAHALHGLATWLDFDAVDAGADHVVLEAVIPPQTAYPWRLLVRASFALGADGLTQSVTVHNESDAPAPWGTGPHPYLVAGEGRVDQWTLTLPADQVLAVTPERLIPTTLRPVDADDPARFDFRAARRIGAVEIDHAYTDLVRDGDADRRGRLGRAHAVGCVMSVGAGPHGRSARPRREQARARGRADDMCARCLQCRQLRLRRGTHRDRAGAGVDGIVADRGDRLTAAFA